MGISENTCFTAVHSSAADYFAFRIKWDALYIDVTYSTEKLYLPSFNRTLVVSKKKKKTAKRRLTGDINEWSKTRSNVC